MSPRAASLHLVVVKPKMKSILFWGGLGESKEKGVDRHEIQLNKKLNKQLTFPPSRYIFSYYNIGEKAVVEPLMLYETTINGLRIELLSLANWSQL